MHPQWGPEREGASATRVLWTPSRAVCLPICASSTLGPRNAGRVLDVRGDSNHRMCIGNIFCFAGPPWARGMHPRIWGSSHWGRWNLAKARLPQGRHRGLPGTELASSGPGSCVAPAFCLPGGLVPRPGPLPPSSGSARGWLAFTALGKYPATVLSASTFPGALFSCQGGWCLPCWGTGPPTPPRKYLFLHQGLAPWDACGLRGHSPLRSECSCLPTFLGCDLNAWGDVSGGGALGEAGPWGGN